MANDFQALLDAVAQLIGGNQPDAVNNPHFYSGYKNQDASGIAGIHGCYSVPPASIQEPPLGILLPGPFVVNSDRAKELLVQAEEYNVDSIRFLLLVRLNDPKTQFANLNPFRDSVPAAIRAHTQLGNPNLIPGMSILQVWVSDGKPGVFVYASTQYIGWDFTIKVARMVQALYVT